WFDPFNPDDWAGFLLEKGVYQPLIPDVQNQLVSHSLGLVLQLWQGNYKGIEATWLRWATLKGELLPTSEEQERRRAESAELQLQQIQSQLQQTARNLLQTGMTVEQVAGLTDLSIPEVEQLGS
ncbi:MAG: Uma2 family endonuclease, partial [Rhizonema sp. PD37]|nr:Uma2 family endonuclease [Rhizonema sp. PD37]